MHRAHREVQQLGGVLCRMVADLPPQGPDPAAINDFRRVLYGLEAILRLHFAHTALESNALPSTQWLPEQALIPLDRCPLCAQHHTLTPLPFTLDLLVGFRIVLRCVP